MNGNCVNGSPVSDLRAQLVTAQKALASVQTRIRGSRLRQWAMGKLCGALLDDATRAVDQAIEQVDAIGSGLMVRGKDGRMRKWEVGHGESRDHL